MKKYFFLSLLGLFVLGLWYAQRQIDQILAGAGLRVAVTRSEDRAIQTDSGNRSPDSKDFMSQHGEQSAQAEAGQSLPSNGAGSDELLTMDDEEWSYIRLIQARFAAGDYQTSLDMIRVGLAETAHSEDFTRWLQGQLKNVLISTGWVAIKTGDCEKGVQDLKLALKEGEDSQISSGLAYCYHHLRMWDQAKEQMSSYLKEKPDDQNAKILYSDILESLLEYDQAISVLQSALSSSDEKKYEDIKNRIRSLKKKREASRYQALRDTQHFRLQYPDDVHPDVVNKIADLLENGLNRLISIYHFRELKSPVEVVLLPQKTFESVMAHHPDWASGIYNGRINVPLVTGREDQYFWERLESVLLHELVHAVLHEMSGRRNLPTWFDEGMAQHFTCIGRDCSVANQQLEASEFFSKDVFEGSFLGYGEANARTLYQQSLFMIQFIEANHSDGLKLISESVQPQGSLRSDQLLKVLDMDFNQLIMQAARQWKMRTSWSGASE